MMHRSLHEGRPIQAARRNPRLAWGVLCLAMCAGVGQADLWREDGRETAEEPQAGAVGEERKAVPASPRPRSDGAEARGDAALGWAGQPSPPASPRELMELRGIDTNLLNGLVDGEPLGASDEECLLRILYRLPQISWGSLQPFQDARQDWSERYSAPAAHRLDVVVVRGRATRVDSVAVAPEAARRYEFPAYYRVVVECDGEPQRAIVATRVIPASWRVGQPLAEPCAAAGFFLKVGGTRGSQPNVVIASSRIAWFPDRENPAGGISSDHVFLARLGMDLGLFDDVRARNRRPLGVQDRECFYQLFAALGRARPEELRQREVEAADLAALLNEPTAHQGRFFDVRGTVLRITKVSVSEPDVGARFGIDHYYQVDVFVSLGDQVIRLGEPSPGKAVPTFSGRFPVTVCVIGLPSSLAEGRKLRRDVRIRAVFFKLWAFRTEYVSSFDERQMQLGPLFLAGGIEPLENTTAPGPLFGWGAVLILLLVSAGSGYGLWRWSRGDSRFRQGAMRRVRGLSPPEREAEEDAGR